MKIATKLLEVLEVDVRFSYLIILAITPRKLFAVEKVTNSSDSTQEMKGITLSDLFVLQVEDVPCEYASSNPISFDVKANYSSEGIKSFETRITLTNIKPIVNETAVNQSTTVLNSDISYNVQYLFRDLSNNPLTWQATLEYGSPLPSWIIFDELTTIFTIKAKKLGSVNVSVTAITFESIPKSQTFNVLINNTPPLAIGSFTDVTILEKVTFDETIGDVSSQFDVERDPNQSLTFSVSSKPCWVNVEWNGAILRTYGTGPYQDIDSGIITVRASDSFEFAELNITVTVNDNPGPVPNEIMTTSYNMLQ